jgi:hypothetical protein
MKHVSFYHKDTGLFTGTYIYASDVAAIPLNTPPDHIAVAGAHDPATHKVNVSTGKIVPL